MISVFDGVTESCQGMSEERREGYISSRLHHASRSSRLHYTTRAGARVYTTPREQELVSTLHHASRSSRLHYMYESTSRRPSSSIITLFARSSSR